MLAIARTHANASFSMGCDGDGNPKQLRLPGIDLETFGGESDGARR